jgi:hypothetical protein
MARFRHLLLAWATLLAGCAAVPPATTPAGTPSPAPSLPVAAAYVDEPVAAGQPGLGGDVVTMPPLPQRLRALALQEWQLWGQGRWDAARGVTERLQGTPRHVESEPAMAARVLAYWLAFKPRDFDPRKIRYDDGSALPWSAAFVSWLITSAGVAERQFEVNELHWGYIRAALEAGKRPGFEAHDAAIVAPAVGDVICAPRDAAADSPVGFAAWRNLARAQRGRRWAWHCDLVVEVGGTEAGAIGGNVSDSVSWTRAPLTAAGLLQSTAERPWTVILRNNLP